MKNTNQERAEKLHAMADRLDRMYLRTKSEFILQRIGKLRTAAYALEK